MNHGGLCRSLGVLFSLTINMHTHITHISKVSCILLSTDLSDLGLGYTDLIEPDKLLVFLPPVVDCGGGRLSRPLTPLPPQLTCMLEEGEKSVVVKVGNDVYGLESCSKQSEEGFSVPVRQPQHAPSPALLQPSHREGWG